MNASPSTFVDAEAVADRFGVTVPTVNRWVREGRIPYFRPTQRVVRFDLSEVEKAIAQPAQQGAGR